MSYAGIALFLLLKNFIHLLHCDYLHRKFITNHQNGTPEKNYELKNSIADIVNTASVDNFYEINATILANPVYISKIEDYILQAQAEYIYRFKHSIFWGYTNVLKKFKIFSPVFKHTNNIFITLIICFLEMFFAYLLGLYLDTTGIGNKILSALTFWASSLINNIR